MGQTTPARPQAASAELKLSRSGGAAGAFPLFSVFVRFTFLLYFGRGVGGGTGDRGLLVEREGGADERFMARNSSGFERVKLLEQTKTCTF